MIPIALAILGFLASRFIFSRFKKKDPFLFRAVEIIYILRIAATILLYFVSSRHLPFLRDYQYGFGFWNFAWDAKVYDLGGSGMAKALAGHGGMPMLGPEWPFVLYVGFVHLLFGGHPLNASILNAWWMNGAALAAGKTIGTFTDDRRSIRIAVLSVLLWPSLFLWSTQGIKEAVMISLILIDCALVLAVWKNLSEGRSVRGWFWAGLWLATFMAAFFRGYVGIALAVASGVVFLPAGLLLLMKRRSIQALFCGFLLLSIVVPAWAGTFISSKEMLAYINPASPRILAQELPRYLGTLRQGIVDLSGSSTVDAGVQVRNLSEMLNYLPRALAILFLAPFPWEWLSSSKGWLERFAGLETLCFYLFLPGLIRSFPVLWRKKDVGLFFLASYIVLLAVPLSVTVPNLGTLFRLRLQVLVPFVVFIAATAGFSIPYIKRSRPLSEPVSA